MKGQGGVPPVIIMGGHQCHRCGKPISDAEYHRNIHNGEHYCDNCIILVLETVHGIQVDCPECHHAVDIGTNRVCQHCGYRITPMACPRCHEWMDANARECPNPTCRWQNPAFVDTVVHIERTMSKKIRAKLYETAIFEIIGAFLLLGLPFFGLPPMPFLAVALMAFLPLYNFLPSEQEAIASRQRGMESLGGEAGGLLVLKSISKTAMFAFAIFDFYRLPVSKLIPLAISWVYYFKLPVSYKETHPFEMIEAWIRVGVGFVIAFLMFLAFIGSQQGMSLFFMALAFFCTSFPRHRHAQPEDQGQVRVSLINVLGKMGGDAGRRIGNILQGEEGFGLDPYLNIAFLFLMTLALQYANVGLSAELATGLWLVLVVASFMTLAGMQTNHVIWIYIIAALYFSIWSGVFGNLFGVGEMENMMQIMFFAVWMLSIVAGYVGGKESRPATGILMIFMALFVFSFTATGVMGTSVFGYWWPQIASTVEAITAPLVPMWGQVQTGMGDAWLIITNPMGYYDIMNKRTQATKSVVKEGGTTKSIELLKTDLFTSTPGELEPLHDILLGSFQIQNQGEFYANQIELSLWSTWMDPKALALVGQTVEPTLTGTLEKFECSQKFDKCDLTTYSDQIGYSKWTERTYPGEIRFVNFVYKKNEWDVVLPDNLANCNYNGTPISCDDDSATFNHSSQQLKVNVNLTYFYNVNVSIPAEVMDQTKYRDLLMARGITLKELTSQYTGGPVKATLWSQRQPIRSAETSLFVASIVNEGGGTLNMVNHFWVLIPKELADQENIEIVAQTFQNAKNTFEGCGSSPVGVPLRPQNGADAKYNLPNYWVIDCLNNYDMKTGEYKRVSFFITPPAAAHPITDSRTFLLVGLANYQYTKTTSTSITIANAPWH